MQRAARKFCFLVFILFAAIGFAAETHDLPFGEWKRASDGPILSPQGTGWESAGTFNPAVIFIVSVDNPGLRGSDVRVVPKIVMLYRAQDAAGTSRLGYAESTDGIHFTRRREPVLSPEAPYEKDGGVEDPRLQAFRGTFYLTYTGYNKKDAQLCLATSLDLIHWERKGVILPAYKGNWNVGWTKSGAIVPETIDEKYWMYWLGTAADKTDQIGLSYSDDLLHWTEATQTPVLPRRPGRFDSRVVEPGPPPILTSRGIVLIYNGADDHLVYRTGAAIFDRGDPRKLLYRSDAPIFSPEKEWEKTGQVPNVVFVEGMVRQENRWLLYYGGADKFVGVADLTQTAALVLRVDIRLLLKKTPEAERDAERAAQLDAEEPGVTLALAQVRFAFDRTDDAIVILQRAFELHPRADVAYVYAQALQKRGREADFDLALRVLLQISITDLRPELRPATVTNTIQCFAKKNDWHGADVYLAKVADVLDPAVQTMMKGYLAHHHGQPQEAQRFATEAHRLLTDNVNADTKESLARLFVLIGRPAEALPLLQELFDKEVPDFDPRSLLTCAAKLDRDDLVMQTSQKLRERGVQDWNLIEFEVQYLEKYKIDDAIHVLQTFIASNPSNNQLAKLRLSFIGLRLNKPELVQARLQDLPPVEDLPLRYATPAVQVMKYGGDPREAVEYAYQFLRLHFADLDAHQAFIISMMPDASISKIPPTLDTVALGTAVCYQEVPHGIPTWVVLEDTEEPSNDFEELSLTSPVAIALMGKKTGETVVLIKGAMQDRTATILQILPKYVRRFQDTMGEMQVRFGAASTVESIRVDQSPDAGPRKGVEVILASVERRAAAVASARDRYTQLPASLHWYGTQFGSDAYQALMNLADEDGQPVKCAQGSPVEREQALRSLQTAKDVIVDMSALATLRLLGLEKTLSSTNFHFTVSERTWVTLQERLSHSKLFATPSGTLYFKDGRHVMYEETAAEKEQRIREDQEFIELLEKTCEVKAAPALAAVEPKKREALEKFFGSYGAESMVLASKPDSVLWTDDLIQAQTSAQEFGSRRVWTQIVLAAFTDLGLLTADEYAEATARLLGMEFVATQFDSLSLLAAFKLASWSASKRPASHVLKTFSDPTTDVRALFNIFVEFTIRIYREPLTPETRCSVTSTFLDIFSNRPGGMQLLTSLRRSSNALFGINAVGRNQFDECFDRWNEQRTSTSIYLP